MREVAESRLLAAVNEDVPLDEIRPKLKGLPSIIHTDSLVEQQAELPVVLKLYNVERSFPIKKVTTLSSLCATFNGKKEHQAMSSRSTQSVDTLYVCSN